MFEIYLVFAVALIAVGAGAGILAIFAIGIYREDKDYSLGRSSRSRITSGLRTVTDAYIHPRLPELADRPRGLTTPRPGTLRTS